MKHATWATALLLTACGQGDYTFTVENDVTSPVIDTGTDSDSIVWEDCGIVGDAAAEVPVDHSCLDGEDLVLPVRAAPGE